MDQLLRMNSGLNDFEGGNNQSKKKIQNTTIRAPPAKVLNFFYFLVADVRIYDGCRVRV